MFWQIQKKISAPGKWESDTDLKATCKKDKVEILEYCKKVSDHGGDHGDDHGSDDDEEENGDRVLQEGRWCCLSRWCWFHGDCGGDDGDDDGDGDAIDDEEENGEEQHKSQWWFWCKAELIFTCCCKYSRTYFDVPCEWIDNFKNASNILYNYTI